MKKLFIFLILIFYSCIFNLGALENKILFKINKEIITSIDLKNEINYLTSTNQNIKSLTKKEVIEIGTNSLIREKIKKLNFKYAKKIELDENFDIIIKDFYLITNWFNEKELKDYLSQNGVEYSYMVNKLSLNTL